MKLMRGIVISSHNICNTSSTTWQIPTLDHMENRCALIIAHYDNFTLDFCGVHILSEVVYDVELSVRCVFAHVECEHFFE